jgi:hypothetical protein
MREGGRRTAGRHDVRTPALRACARVRSPHPEQPSAVAPALGEGRPGSPATLPAGIQSATASTIQAPVQAVLDPPGAAHRVRESLGVGRDGVDEDTPLHGMAILDPAFALARADAAQGAPTRGVGHGAQLLGDPVPAYFQTSVVLVGRARHWRTHLRLRW